MSRTEALWSLLQRRTRTQGRPGAQSTPTTQRQYSVECWRDGTDLSGLAPRAGRRRKYYVKTTEDYATYAFTVGTGEHTRRVRLGISAATTDRDNVKEAAGRQRRFVLSAGDGAVAVESGELVVRFEHRPLTDGKRTGLKHDRSRVACLAG